MPEFTITPVAQSVKASFVHIAALDHLDDGQTELFRELPVAGVVAGHRHDGAGAVGHQHIVGDEDGDLLAVHGVHGRARPPAGRRSCPCATSVRSKSLFLAAASWYALHLVQVGDLVRPFLNAGVLGRDDHVGRAEQRVRAGGVDEQLVARRGGEVYLRAGGAADPVLLLRLARGRCKSRSISRSSISRWAYSVIFSIHWLLTLCTTSPPQRSHTPPTTSSLASTTLQEVHQLTLISFL